MSQNNKEDSSSGAGEKPPVPTHAMLQQIMDEQNNFNKNMMRTLEMTQSLVDSRFEILQEISEMKEKQEKVNEKVLQIMQQIGQKEGKEKEDDDVRAQLESIQNSLKETLNLKNDQEKFQMEVISKLEEMKGDIDSQKNSIKEISEKLKVIENEIKNEEDDILEYLQKDFEKEAEINFTVKTLCGKVFHFAMLPTDTIFNLAQKIEEVFGVLTTEQRIIFRQKQRDPEETLQEVGIENGSIVHLVLSLR